MIGVGYGFRKSCLSQKVIANEKSSIPAFENVALCESGKDKFFMTKSKLPRVSVLDTESGKFMVFTALETQTETLIKLGTHGYESIEFSKVLMKYSTQKHIVDIGACFGTYSIPLARDQSLDLEISAFEPQKTIFYQLCGNIFLNQLDNINAYNIAIGDEDGFLSIPEIDFNKCWNIGGVSISKEIQKIRGDFPKDSIIGEKMIEMKKLDSIKDLKPAGLIKIDVEGYEIKALDGMRNYLLTSGYPPIIFETWDYSWFKDIRKELFELLKSIGYVHISKPFDGGNHLAQHLDSIHPILFFEYNEQEDKFSTVLCQPGTLKLIDLDLFPRIVA